MLTTLHAENSEQAILRENDNFLFVWGHMYQNKVKYNGQNDFLQLKFLIKHLNNNICGSIEWVNYFTIFITYFRRFKCYAISVLRMWRFPTSIYDRGFNNHSIEIPPLLIEKAMFGHSQHGVLRQSDCYANFADQQYQHSFTQGWFLNNRFSQTAS